MRLHNRGITLVELLIVMVIVAILAAIAYPSYRQQVLRSSRTEAKTTIMQQAQALEKCFTRYGRYDDAACAAATAVVNGAEGRYQMTAVAGATTFTLTATPQGGQAADAQCGNFTLDQSGLRGISGPGNVADCW